MAKVTAEQATNELRLLFQAWTTAVGAVKEYAFLDRHLADGWVYTDFNGSLRGKDEYIDLVANIVSYTQDFQRFDVRVAGDDTAIVTGVYRACVEFKNGTTGDNTIALSALWQLQGGVWRSLLLHTTRLAEPSAGWPRQPRGAGSD